jgi:hypothetical protein
MLKARAAARFRAQTEAIQAGKALLAVLFRLY